MLERIFIASIEQSNSINASEDTECTRDDMASLYMDCIIADQQAELQGMTRVDWHAVNMAILERWSKSGLLYIKTKAHKKLAGATKGINPYSSS